MNVTRARRRNRIWLLVASGWMTLAAFGLLGLREPRDDAVSARAVAQQPQDTGQSVADGWITTKIKATYAYSRWIDGSDIMVVTFDGIVRLTGSAGSSAEKELAIELAQQIDGVREVDATGLKAG